MRDGHLLCTSCQDFVPAGRCWWCCCSSAPVRTVAASNTHCGTACPAQCGHFLHDVQQMCFIGFQCATAGVDENANGGSSPRTG